MISSSIHAVVDDRILFFFMAESYSIAHMVIFFIHSSVDGNVGDSISLTVVNHAAINMHV
jgi:hypothetical protein